MKLRADTLYSEMRNTFSALGRAVWDETFCHLEAR